MLQALKKYFGYSEFRPLQQEIITAILNKKDVFVLMPTGGGKSICYQLPSVLQDGLTIVVSPLISLMKDQVDGLIEAGIKAAFINSSLDYAEIEQIKLQLQNNEIDLLYVAPERLMMPDFLDFVNQLKVTLFAIDEVHCISEWGHDFRPEYRKLSLLKQKFPQTPIAALTATATPIVQQDIINHLQFENFQTFKASFNRENLFYQIIPKDDTYQKLCDYLEAHKNESGIIYCQSRRTVDSVAESLKYDGFSALPYHAGMDKDERTKNQDMFIKDNVNIIVATIAFGMGIDKPNVRFVIHYDLPKNLESYYQETGRAGRDGLKSDCILFYSYGDRMKIEYFINEKEDLKQQQIAIEKLNQMIQYCESRNCRRVLLLDYFGETFGENKCNTCDNCLKEHELFDATEAVQKFLSCVARVNERFGVNYIIDVLRGSNSERIIQNRHNLISTYNIGKEYTKKQWQKISREMIQLGYLNIEGGQYPVVTLTPKSKGVLFANEKVFLTKFDEEQVVQENVNTSYNQQLFEELRKLRKRIADEQDVPPYIVFPDTTLKEMATYFPMNWNDLRRMTGVGEQKLYKYGPRFLKCIVGFCQENENVNSYSIKNKRNAKRMRIPTEQETLELLKQGMTIKQCAEQRGLATSTIATHIEKLIIAGENIIIDKFVDIEKQRIIRKALLELGADRLSPLKEYLGNEYSYDEIRLVRAKLFTK